MATRKKINATGRHFKPVRPGVVARAEQRQTQKWWWFEGRWWVPSTLSEHHLRVLTNRESTPHE